MLIDDDDDDNNKDNHALTAAVSVAKEI